MPNRINQCRIEPPSAAKCRIEKSLCGTASASNDNGLQASAAKCRVERQLSRVRECVHEAYIHTTTQIARIFHTEFLPFYAALRGTEQVNGIKHWRFQCRVGEKLCGTYAALSASTRHL